MQHIDLTRIQSSRKDCHKANYSRTYHDRSRTALAKEQNMATAKCTRTNSAIRPHARCPVPAPKYAPILTWSHDEHSTSIAATDTRSDSLCWKHTSSTAKTDVLSFEVIKHRRHNSMSLKSMLCIIFENSISLNSIDFWSREQSGVMITAATCWCLQCSCHSWPLHSHDS